MTRVIEIPKLTPRELEIVRLAGLRLGDKEIAQQLNLSPRTVQNHLHRAYDKLGVSDRLQAARRLSDLYSGGSIPLSEPVVAEPSAPVTAALSTALGDGKARRAVDGRGGPVGGVRAPKQRGGGPEGGAAVADPWLVSDLAGDRRGRRQPRQPRSRDDRKPAVNFEFAKVVEDDRSMRERPHRTAAPGGCTRRAG